MQTQIKVWVFAQVFKIHGLYSTQDDFVTSVCILSCQRAVGKHQKKVTILSGPVRITNSHPRITIPYDVNFLQHGVVVDFPHMSIVKLSSTSSQNTRNVPLLDASESKAFAKLNKPATIVPADTSENSYLVSGFYSLLG